MKFQDIFNFNHSKISKDYKTKDPMGFQECMKHRFAFLEYLEWHKNCGYVGETWYTEF